MERFAVIGLGRFGTRLARLLAESGADVIAIDRRKDLIEALRDDVTRAICLDATNEEALRSQGIENIDTAIVSIGTAFESAVLTTVILKQIGVPRVISRATSSIRSKVLSRIGADDIVNPEREAADRWRNRLLAAAVMERIELADEVSLVQAPAPEKFFGKTLGELDVRKNHHLQVVAIRRKVEDLDADSVKRTSEILISVPMADTIVKKSDILLLIGSDEAIHNLVS